MTDPTANSACVSFVKADSYDVSVLRPQIEAVLAPLGGMAAIVKSGDRVAVMVNGLGGTPPSELYVLYRRAAQRCSEAGLTIVRNYVGEYCTSLEMAGASLTLLRLDDELEQLLAAPAEIAVRVF